MQEHIRAIHNLEKSLKAAQASLTDTRKSLENLEEVHVNLTRAFDAFKHTMDDEPESEALNQLLASTNSEYHHEASLVILRLLDIHRVQVEHLVATISCLESELTSRKQGLKMANHSERAFSQCRSQILPILDAAKIVLSPIRRVPTEVWIIIFCLRGFEDIETYTQVDGAARPRPSPLTLSGVCRGWRGITKDLPILWESVFIPPTSAWTHSWMECSRHALSILGKRPANFIASLGEPDRRPYHYNYYNDSSPDEFTPSSVVLIVDCDPSTALDRAFEFPFHNVTSLTLIHNRGEIQSDSEIPAYFPSLQRLTLVDILPNSFETLQSLTYLRLKLHSPPPSIVILLLGSTLLLEELHIQVDQLLSHIGS